MKFSTQRKIDRKNRDRKGGRLTKWKIFLKSFPNLTAIETIWK